MKGTLEQDVAHEWTWELRRMDMSSHGKGRKCLKGSSFEVIASAATAREMTYCQKAGYRA